MLKLMSKNIFQFYAKKFCLSKPVTPTSSGIIMLQGYRTHTYMRVNIAFIEGSFSHVVVKIPYSNSIITGTRQEGIHRKNRGLTSRYSRINLK